MEFIKEWADFQNQQSQVFKAFGKWHRDNLIITAGTKVGSIEEKFGLPYTSSGAYAGCWCTNCEASYKFLPQFHFDGIAISKDCYIVATFTHKEDYLKNLEIIIGEVK